MTYESLRDQCLQRGVLYEDPEFPASHSSVYYSKVDRSIVWRRPTELSDSPEFLVGGACRQDLHQGSVGNCWYIAGVATLACHPSLFERVVPKDQGFKENYAGIFHFWFWKYGRWVEVIIDDRLPTYYGKQIIFCNNRAQPNEFWSALMEKAYAKYSGSYEALDGGWTEDALVDFTGGVGERRNLSDKAGVPKGLFREMMKGFRMSTLYGCSINASPDTMESELSNGLVIGHAYSVTKVMPVELNGVRHQLIRLRNPWGEREWKGAWSDRSKEWKQVDAVKRLKLGLSIDEDGEFWISFQDLVANFDQLQICHLPPKTCIKDKKEWKEHMYHGSWVKGVSAGGCGNSPFQDLYWTNPQYSVTLRDVDEDEDQKCTLIVSLMQTHTRLKRTQLKIHDSNEAIGFSIYRVKFGVPAPIDGRTYDRYSLLSTETSGDFTFCREVSGHYLLDPGNYVIIPATFLFNTQANFLLRAFTEKEITSSDMDVPTGPIQIPPDSQDLLKDLFHKYRGSDKTIDARELQQILNEAFTKELMQEQGFEVEACRSLLSMMDRDFSGVLEFDELRTMWKELKIWQTVFHQHDHDQSGFVNVKELRTMFKDIGFNLSRGVLRSIVRRYGGKNNKLIFQDFVVVATKIVVMMDKFTDFSKEGYEGKAEMTLDQWMQLVLYF